MSFGPLLGLLLLAPAGPAPCTQAEAQLAEAGIDTAGRSWADLHDQYVKFAKRAACDDGAIAEGFSDAVGNLLARGWKELPKLARLINADPDFLAFVVKHIDLTIPAVDLDHIRANAKSSCPGKHGRVCNRILHALARVYAEATLSRHASDAAWRSLVELDLDGDGLVDFALVGSTASEAVVGVVLGASPDRPLVLRLKADPTLQGGICGSPGNARITVEDLSAPDARDEDVPETARAGVGDRRRGFRLDSGECDAFHFYFDGKTVTWWRR